MVFLMLQLFCPLLFRKQICECVLLRDRVNSKALFLLSFRVTFKLDKVYAEACNELVGPISASLRPGNTAPFEEISQRWLAVGNTASDLTGRDLNFRPPDPETNALPLADLI